MLRRWLPDTTSKLVEDLKPLLRRYLEDRGVAIDSRGFWRCFHPKHTDDTPSTHFVPGSQEQVYRCFGCGARGDVMDAFALLEGTASTGPRWLHETVYPLARRYSIPFEEPELTEQQQIALSLYRLFHDAAAVFADLCEKDPDTGYLHTRARGYRDETCRQMGVGSVSWRSFLAQMKTCGHEPAYMKQYGLDQSMFDREHITFVIRDPDGEVIGFARRWTQYDKKTAKAMSERGEGHQYPPKYKNTPGTVPFFQKESVLYGLDTARMENHRRLDIFEGYTDTLAARQVGYIPTVSALGTGLTTFHLEQAKAEGFTHINLVFDDDEAGHLAAEKHLASAVEVKEIHLTAMFLPFDDSVPPSDRDPDGFFRIYGLENYLKLKPISAFDWVLNKRASVPGVKLDQLAMEMAPIILQQPNRILRGSMVKTLSQRTGTEEMDIRAEMAKLENEQVDALSDDLTRRLHYARDSVERQDLITRYSGEIAAIRQEKTGTFTVEETATAFAKCISDFETHKEGLTGYKTGWPIFDEKFDGLPKTGSIFGFAGGANVGKSAFVTTLATNLCIYNPDQVAVIYHIMDDPRKIAFAKLMARLTGYQIRNIIRASTDILPFEHRRQRYETVRTWLYTQMKKGNLIVKGQELGVNTRAATKMIDHLADVRGISPIYIGDSLHSMSPDVEVESERLRTKRVVEWSQEMSDTRDLTMIFTLEITKQGMRGRPRMDAVSETGKIDFAFKALGMLYNELHDLRDEATTFWTQEVLDPETGKPVDPVRRPIIEINWDKNKVADFKDKMYWKLWPHCAFCEEISYADVQQFREQNKGKRFNPDDLSRSFEAALPPAFPHQVNQQ